MSQNANSDTRFDAIIVGGGHNGLTAAATLARKGKRVCVVERLASLGGMMASSDPEHPDAPPRLAHLLHNIK